MESQSWFLCLILSFGLVVLSDAQYVPPPEFGRKRNAEDILQVNRLLDFSIAINFLTYTDSYEFKTISYKKNCFVRIYFCKSHFSVTDFILRAIWYIFFVQ